MAFSRATSEVTIGVPKETFPGESRVSVSPDATAKLIKQGFKVQVEQGAGLASNFTDEAF